VSSLRELREGDSMKSVPRVVGLGNLLAGDDSVGIELIRLLRDRPILDCELLEVTQPGLNLLELCEGNDWILFLDGVSSGAPAGTIYLIPLPSAEVEVRSITALSSHGFGLPEVIDLCRALHRPITALMLLGIEMGTVKLGDSRSPEVESAMQAVISAFPHLQMLLRAPNSAVWKESHRYSAESLGQLQCAEMGHNRQRSAHIA
jgi:hydrogenase maturation protease